MKYKVYDTFKDREIAVIGLGYVGLTLSVVMAELGFKITGVEINNNILESLNSGSPHFFEPGLDSRYHSVWKSGLLTIHDEIPKEYNGKVYIITVGTPLNDIGIINLDMVSRVTKNISETMLDGSLIIGRSTVKIGTTENIIKPILQKSGKKFNLAFCPERTLEGKALEELRYLPQIIGADDIESSMRTTQIFQFITPTIIRVTDTRTAEMIKLIDNTSRDVGFAFANEVAAMCDSIGISAIEVINSGKQGYPRTNVPLPGPVGGPCLSKDPHILVQSLIESGYNPKITSAARIINESQPNELANFLYSFRKLNGSSTKELSISLLGLAFKGKPATDDLRGSMAIPVYNSLKKVFDNSVFTGYDPLVDIDSVKNLGLIYQKDLVESFLKADMAIILNNHSIFSTLSLNLVADKMNTHGIIYDFWNHFNSNEYEHLPNGVKYISLGSHGKAKQ
jgi:UDP-N-acetyl-D-mannosaminuronic acid dehydrogenase